VRDGGDFEAGQIGKCKYYNVVKLQNKLTLSDLDADMHKSLRRFAISPLAFVLVPFPSFVFVLVICVEQNGHDKNPQSLLFILLFR